MKIDSLGHVVLKVTDLAQSRAFYHGLLGIPISAESDPWRMIFFTLGDHHNFAILEVGADAPKNFVGVGVDHFAFKIAGGKDGLRKAKQELEGAGVELAPVDHHVSYSLYFNDPDGNRLEIYVDGVEGWETDPNLILKEATLLELDDV
jgi:catechol-2,3-dioxygenase